MATQPAPAARFDIRQIADESGVAVEAYDTYDTDEETLAAAQRFAAAILTRAAVICESQPGLKVLDGKALRALAAGVLPR